jgi:uncharacterized protein (TIGR03435 family)
VQTRLKQRIRGLLADRFKLVTHVENRKMSVYALTVAGGGAKLLKAATPGTGCVFDTGPAGCHYFPGGYGHPLNANAAETDDLAQYIGNWTDLPVVNRTGLSGLFTLKTEGWKPMRLPPPPPGSIPEANPFAGLPTIFTILGRLGLELKRQEAVLPVYTVMHIERPTIN